MKNKIYNAIQKGLSNVLVFDSDESINYQKSNINNEIEFPQVSLDELYDIFKEKPDDIFGYDTKDCLSLILDNNSEISLHEYKMSDNPVFLKISNNILKETGNDIIIACNNNHYISSNKLQWQTEYKQILPNKYLTSNKQKAVNDFNGYRKCQMILNSINDKSTIPSIHYCDNIERLVFKGYLPSIGQLNFIFKYLDIINYIFKYINVELLNLNFGWCQSSSESSYNYIWYLDNGNINIINKRELLRILPLFSFKK